jgi:hypothetical protein
MSSPSAPQQRKLINSSLRHAKKGDWEELSQLLDDPDVIAAGLEYRHENPLHEAIISGHPEIVQRLIDRGFSVEEKGPNPYSAIQLKEAVKTWSGNSLPRQGHRPTLLYVLFQ